MDDDPYLVAVEQYLYWRELGFSNDAMVRAVCLEPLNFQRNDAEATIQMLAHAYRMMMARRGAA